MILYSLIGSIEFAFDVFFSFFPFQLTSIPLAPLFLNAIGHQFCSKTSVAATEKSSTPVPTEEEEDIEANEGMEVEGAVTSDPGGSDDGGDYNDYNDTDLQDAEEETFLDARESFGGDFHAKTLLAAAFTTCACPSSFISQP